MISQIQHSLNTCLLNFFFDWNNLLIKIILIAFFFVENICFTCNPLCFACANVIDLPKDIRISPGVAIERKQQENNNNSHHELINKQI
jgi:hypothetical protein